MSLGEYQQAHTHLGSSKNILIIAGEKDIDDTYPASLALARALKQNKKEILLFTPRKIPERLSFLENEIRPRHTIPSTQDIIISIDTSQKPVEGISYTRSDSRLDIRITPKTSTRIEEQDVHISLSGFSYDSIITIGVDDLASLGKEFEQNASLFYETPIINLDKSPSNERYGEVNIIDPACSSCSEITTILLKKWDENLITKEVATSLLAGIIGATANFQNLRTKPSALSQAAYLMSKDADQQSIIKNLFKTKSFEFLRLWGIAMAKLQYIENSRLTWLTITQNDFLESGADAKSIPPLLGEIINNFALANLFIIFWENHHGYFGIARSTYEDRTTPLAKLLKGERRGANIVFSVPSKDISYQKKIVDTLSYALVKNELQ